MYDAENEQKKLLLAVSTHATKKIMTGASILFFTGTAFLFLVIATNFWMRIWINILTTSWAIKHFIFHFHFPFRLVKLLVR
jgi:accessory gene regulator protein AgrB